MSSLHADMTHSSITISHLPQNQSPSPSPTPSPSMYHSSCVLDVLCDENTDRSSPRTRKIARNRNGGSADTKLDPTADAQTIAASATATPAAIAALPSSTSSTVASSSPYIIILLNQRLDHFFFALWRGATYRVCADGATNRLYRYFKSEEERQQYLPHAIIGDLDSVKPHILDYYRSQSAAVYLRRDVGQDNTDLEKSIDWITAEFARFTQPQEDMTAADQTSVTVDEWNLSALETHRSTTLSELQSYISSSAPSVPLLVYPAFGGRFDQQMAHIHIAYKYTLQQEERRKPSIHDNATSSFLHPSHPLILLAEGNLVRVLLPHFTHHIVIHPYLEDVAPIDEPTSNAAATLASAAPTTVHCGLWPLNDTAESVTTSGLKWNLHQTKMSWSQMISTSNVIQPQRRMNNIDTKEIDTTAGDSQPGDAASPHIVTILSDTTMVWTTECQLQHRRKLSDEDGSDQETS